MVISLTCSRCFITPQNPITMAKFSLKPTELIIPKEHEKTKIFLTTEVVPENVMISIAGHAIIRCLKIEIERPIFDNHPLTHAEKLNGKTLTLEVNVSKIKTGEGEENGAKIPVNCKLIIEAGDTLLEEYELDDKKTPTSNSIFTFTIKFKISDESN
jgi:hypothetical protein